MLDFGIAFTDKDDNEHYATVYKSTDPTTLYAIHFHDQQLALEYDVLCIGAVNDKLVTISYPDKSIPDITDRIAGRIYDYLREHNLSVG